MAGGAYNVRGGHAKFKQHLKAIEEKYNMEKGKGVKVCGLYIFKELGNIAYKIIIKLIDLMHCRNLYGHIKIMP